MTVEIRMTRIGLGRMGAAAITILASAVPALSRQESGTTPKQESQVAAGSSEEIEALRREIEKLKEMIRILQSQVEALGAGGGASPPPAPPSPPPQAPVAPTRSQSLLNPAISGVLQTIGNTS